MIIAIINKIIKRMITKPIGGMAIGLGSLFGCKSAGIISPQYTDFLKEVLTCNAFAATFFADVHRFYILTTRGTI